METEKGRGSVGRSTSPIERYTVQGSRIRIRETLICQLITSYLLVGMVSNRMSTIEFILFLGLGVIWKHSSRIGSATDRSACELGTPRAILQLCIEAFLN